MQRWKSNERELKSILSMYFPSSYSMKNVRKGVQFSEDVRNLISNLNGQ
ncbi:hypothetical protein [Priestia megaterium]|nr:hypothetical protein [Priestia megaterium]MCA4158011.1 hypothetical protein [Priestia megaterium]